MPESLNIEFFEEYFGHLKNQTIYNDMLNYNWNDIIIEIVEKDLTVLSDVMQKKKDLCIKSNIENDHFIYNIQSDIKKNIENNKSKTIQKNFHTVYVHVFPDGMVYVGQTNKNNPQNRFGNNGEKYKANKKLFDAILKYGWENVHHIIICNTLTQEQANYLEEYLIKKYHSNDSAYGYNYHSGGNAWNGQEYKEKIVELILNKFFEKEQYKIAKSVLQHMIFPYTKPQLKLIYEYVKNNTNYILSTLKNKKFDNGRKKAAYIISIIQNWMNH